MIRTQEATGKTVDEARANACAGGRRRHGATRGPASLCFSSFYRAFLHASITFSFSLKKTFKKFKKRLAFLISPCYNKQAL